VAVYENQVVASASDRPALYAQLRSLELDDKAIVTYAGAPRVVVE